METKIGKIESIYVGFGGYQDAMLGLSVTLVSPNGSWGVGDFKGTWGPDIECSDHCKWTEADRQISNAYTMEFIGSLLKDAKKSRVEELKGVPIEVTLEGSSLKSWRILTEVI